jgi:hypothetical protein
MAQLRRYRPSPAMVVALIALFVALGGTSYAAITLSKNSVRSKHIGTGQVKRADIAANAITRPRLTTTPCAKRTSDPGRFPKDRRAIRVIRAIQAPRT